jgi:hypothetical protein
VPIHLPSAPADSITATVLKGHTVGKKDNDKNGKDAEVVDITKVPRTDEESDAERDKFLEDLKNQDKNGK